MHKLPVYRVVGLSWRHIIRHKFDFLRLGGLWFMIPIGMAVLAPVVGGAANPWYRGIETGIAYLAGLIVARAWIRHVLLHERSRGPAKLNASALRYLLWNPALIVLAAVPAAPAIAYAAFGSDATYVGMAKIVAILIAVPFVVRLALVFAPVAIEHDGSKLEAGWQAGRGSWLRLLAAFVLIAVSGYVVTLLLVIPLGSIIMAADPGAALPDHPSFKVVDHLLTLLFVGLTSGLIAWSWKALTEGDQALPTA
ncbi:MAG TPA: hypothetical protein VHL31_03295 [Geminicoccus sp.]|uniref:hypothetical protein n=1 Tax=Geminicoccus sp. TaxID=2024832 RepID=UPI002E30919C|nr:hypothetical protein [Geminicoccus sp.]HEX2525312.1 hypothetical protein [Geminicoccus sp.]